MPRKIPGALFLCLLLIGFNCGIESFRQGDLGDIPRHPLKILSPPWLPLRAYVSRNGDEALYWQDSRLALGEDPDLDYLADKRQGDRARNRAEIASQIRPGPAPRAPYRDFPFEYPPVPLALMLLPRAVADSLPAYRVAYGALVALLTLLAGVLGSRVAARAETAPTPGAREAFWRRLAWLTLAIGPMLVGRFDILPAVLVTAALLLLAGARPFLAGVCAGVAVMAKLYPLFLIALWTAVLLGWGMAAAAFALVAGALATIALISAPFLWIAPAAFLKSSFLYGARPFQIESVPGALTALIGGKASIFGAFGSYNASLPDWMGALWSPLLLVAVIGCVALAAIQARAAKPALNSTRTPDPGQIHKLLAWSAALISVILMASKVLSPQFLIWLLPLVPFLPGRSGRRAFKLFIAAAFLTQLYYPYLYDFLVRDGSRWVAAIVVARNLALVALAFELLRGSASAPRSYRYPADGR